MTAPTTTDAQRARGAGIAAVVLAVSAFSWGFVLVKSIDLPPPVLGFWRVLLGAGILSLAALVLRVPWPRPWGMVALAGLLFGCHQLVFIAATKLTSISIVTTIGATQPLLVVLLSRRVVGESVPPRLLGCAALAIAGVALVMSGSLGSASRNGTGDLLAILNVFTFTGYFLAAKRARQNGAPTLTFSAGFLWMALPVIVPAMLLSTLYGTSPATPTTSHQWLLLMILVLGPANGHLLLNWAHNKITAALSALILATVPLLSSIWAYAVLDESLGWQHAAGIALVIAAIELGRRAEMRRAALADSL